MFLYVWKTWSAWEFEWTAEVPESREYYANIITYDERIQKTIYFERSNDIVYLALRTCVKISRNGSLAEAIYATIIIRASVRVAHLLFAAHSCVAASRLQWSISIEIRGISAENPREGSPCIRAGVLAARFTPTAFPPSRANLRSLITRRLRAARRALYVQHSCRGNILVSTRPAP